MKQISKVLILSFIVGIFGAANNISLVAQDIEKTYTTSSTITYTTPTFINRANIIGTYSQYAPLVTINNGTGWDLMHWTTSSTYNATITSRFYERFSTSYTGYKNIEFIARPQEAHGIEVSENLPEKQGLYFVFDYNAEQGQYVAAGGYGRDVNGKIIENLHASNDRSRPLTLQETQMYANTPYEIEQYSFTDLNIEKPSLNYNGYAYPISVDEKQPHVVAKLGNAKSAEIYYEREFTLPVEFFDELQQYYIAQGIYTGNYLMTIKNMKWKYSAVKYSYDVNLKVLDQMDQKVRAGDNVSFASNLETEFQGSVAADETLPISEQYFETSSDGGLTWNKVSSDHVMDEETIRFVATPEMNGSLYRYVAVANDATKTKVISKAGKLEVETYAVSFNANTTEGVNNMPDTLAGIYPSATIANPSKIPQRKGYTFIGWYSDANLQNIENLWNFETSEVNGNMTLYAKWAESESFNVSFVSDGGTNVDNQQVEPNEFAVRPSNPTKDGYMFMDWYVDTTYTTLFDFTTPILEDTTIYGKFIAHDDIRVDVLFDSDGGTLIDGQNIEIDTLVSKPSDPVKDGYTFMDWYTDATYSTLFDFATPITMDTVVYGKFVKKESTSVDSLYPNNPFIPSTLTEAPKTSANEVVSPKEISISKAPKTNDTTRIASYVILFMVALIHAMFSYKRIKRNHK